MTIPLDVPIVEIPIACTLANAEMAARRQKIMGSVLSQVTGRQELADGYAFRFPNTDEIAQELLAFALLERQCCSFFQIELAFSPGKGPTWLRLRGEDGVKRFIETELTVTNEF